MFMCSHRARPPIRPPPSPYTTLFRSRIAARRLQHPVQGEIAQRIYAQMVTYLHDLVTRRNQFAFGGRVDAVIAGRSEEHTSELQSLTNLVCRLLLEKKNAPAPRSCGS